MRRDVTTADLLDEIGKLSIEVDLTALESDKKLRNRQGIILHSKLEQVTEDLKALQAEATSDTEIAACQEVDEQRIPVVRNLLVAVFGIEPLKPGSKP